MALGTFVPGDYTWTYAAAAPGLITSAGFHLRYKRSVKKINNTSTYADTLIDGIYRGMTGVQLVCTVKEWNVTVKAAIWPNSLTAGGSPSLPLWNGTNGLIGTLDSAKAQIIVLTATASTPAAALLSPATLTANLAILSPDNDIDILMGPDERDVPVVFDLLLYDDSGTKRFFAIT